MKTAVILTTYNKPDVLAASLDAYNAQSIADFELLIADDGSGAETAQVIAAFQKRAKIAVRHIWQEDKGFRAAAIRNRALAATTAEYVIFSDGDCIPSARFVEWHQRLAERGWFVAGSRVLLSETFTAMVLRKRLPIHEWCSCHWLGAVILRRANRWFTTVPVLLPGAFRKLPARNWRGIMTCNLSCWRDDALTINGFDEAYEGWGMEDSDLVIRLLNAGIFHKSARFAAAVFHLWHQENDRSNIEKNMQRLLGLLESGNTKAQKGLG